MYNFKLKVNDRIEVLIQEKAYKALILDIQDDFLKINLPVYNGDYLLLNSGKEIEIISYLDEGRCYSFHAKVFSREKEGNIILYKISTPFDIKHIQRRNFFRVGLLNKIEYKKITMIDEEDFDNIPYKQGFMVDLSAGGLKLKIKDNIDKEDLLLINTKVNGLQLELKCDIVRIEDTLDKEKLCGLRFIDIMPAQSEKIIQELFQIMRKQRANT